ncbi:membrane hypothetical protein [Hyella patelloides LEGE 07179]|uniref:Uncharacterized protein n=1 Tax=Hyella patelloides LEGE 07179 TaxID=945734 RepID=A0A563VTK1_9CYAN|nr:hypothetical protein [Hyella patelloides]VEP14770.1 membrane hypothetical protein [Hyella patelloides LEGE 07179]
MEEEQILKAIAQCLADSEIADVDQYERLHFQIVMQDDVLHLYINRETDEDCDYQKLTDLLSSVIIDLEIVEPKKIWFYSRILGEVEPDWQTLIEIETDNLATVDTNKNPEIEQESENVPEIQLLASESLELESQKDADILVTVDGVEKEPEFDLAQYCFIRNQRLLNAELIPPRLNIAQLITTLDRFSEFNRRSQLLILEAYFLNATNPDLSDCDSEVKAWWTDILELSPDENRKLAIWLSRYCYNSEQTLAITEAVFAAQAAIDDAKKAASQGQAQAKNSSTTEYNPNLPISAAQGQDGDTSATSKRQNGKYRSKPKFFLNLALPIGWTLVTLIIVIIGINSAKSTALPTICDEATGDKSYCYLATEIVSEKILTESTQNKPAFKPESLDMSLEYCQIYGNIAAGFALKEASSYNNPLLSVSGEEILSGIYVVDVEQVSLEEESTTVRTVCIFEQTETTSWQKGINLLGMDQIDPAWPEVAYQPSEKQQSLNSLNQALGAYSFFSNFGLNTLFTAIMIYVLAISGMAIRADSLETIYQASFILGIVESILAYLPVIGWWVQVPLECIALGITSSCIKGFHIDWSAGYRFVSATALLLIVSRLLLNWLFLALLFKIFS